MLEALVSALINFTHALGYTGIFIMTMLESTFVPIPCEFTMIPAGFLAYRGDMEVVPLFLTSLAGTLTGSLMNYAIAYKLGRKLLLKYPHIFRIDEQKMEKMESFFHRHGPFSIFIGRLIFGVRHYISFPAGLAKMDLGKFSFYTLSGAAIWLATLITLGYVAGGNQAFIKEALPAVKIIFLVAVCGAITLYVLHHRHKKRRTG